MVTIVDYGVGNLFSLKSSFAFIGEEAVVSGDYGEISKADRIILPGVGAFEDAALKLKEKNLDELLRVKAKEGTPVLGICLGMQLFFDNSYEYGKHSGLSLIRGDVLPIKEEIAGDLKVPHMGWNSLDFKGKKHPIFKYVGDNDFVYFVHSFYAKPSEEGAVIATTYYGKNLTAAVGKDSVVGCQFHPEKSGKVGLGILKAFCEWGAD